MPASLLSFTSKMRVKAAPNRGHEQKPCVRSVAQSLLASVRHFQQKLQDSHERSKTVTRSADMKVIRESMQVGGPAQA